VGYHHISQHAHHPPKLVFLTKSKTIELFLTDNYAPACHFFQTHPSCCATKAPGIHVALQHVCANQKSPAVNDCSNKRDLNAHKRALNTRKRALNIHKRALHIRKIALQLRLLLLQMLQYNAQVKRAHLV